MLYYSFFESNITLNHLFFLQKSTLKRTVQCNSGLWLDQLVTTKDRGKLVTIMFDYRLYHGICPQGYFGLEQGDIFRHISRGGDISKISLEVGTYSM